MKNPNLIIQEKYSSHLVRKTLGKNKRLCQLTSLIINQDNDLYLCPHSPSFGKLNANLTNALLRIAEYKETLHANPECCLCHESTINFSLLSEDYLTKAHPIKELTVYSTLDSSLFESLITQLDSLKNINLVAVDELSLFSFLKIIPQDFSVRIFLNENILNENILNFLNTNFYFATIDCTKTFTHSFDNQNLIFINFIVNDTNFSTATEDFVSLLQKEYSVTLTSQFSNEETLTDYAHLLLKLESRYDTYFLKAYESLEHQLPKKLKQMLKLKWLNISLQSNRFCYIPFTEIAISADGSYQPCCWITDYDLRDSETGNDIAKVWNGKRLKALRNEFITGDIRICKNKIQEFACNQTRGPRQQLMGISSHQNRPMFKFHWYFNGSCNLKCQMCTTWLQDKEFAESEIYYENLKKESLPYISEMELVGGEPFYQKRTFALIEYMKQNNPLCVWNITSNGQFNFNGKIKEALLGLRLGTFSISIDSLIPEKFSKIRVDGVLKQTQDFLENLIQFNNSKAPGFKFTINVNFVIQKDNWEETENLILFAQDKQVNLYISPLADMPQFSIYTLEEKERNRCQLYLKMLYNKYHHPNLLNLINNLGDVREK